MIWKSSQTTLKQRRFRAGAFDRPGSGRSANGSGQANIALRSFARPNANGEWSDDGVMMVGVTAVVYWTCAVAPVAHTHPMAIIARITLLLICAVITSFSFGKRICIASRWTWNVQQSEGYATFINRMSTTAHIYTSEAGLPI